MSQLSKITYLLGKESIHLECMSYIFSYPRSPLEKNVQEYQMTDDLLKDIPVERNPEIIAVGNVNLIKNCFSIFDAMALLRNQTTGSSLFDNFDYLVIHDLHKREILHLKTRNPKKVDVNIHLDYCRLVNVLNELSSKRLFWDKYITRDFEYIDLKNTSF